MPPSLDEDGSAGRGGGCAYCWWTCAGATRGLVFGREGDVGVAQPIADWERPLAGVLARCFSKGGRLRDMCEEGQIGWGWGGVWG